MTQVVTFSDLYHRFIVTNYGNNIIYYFLFVCFFLLIFLFSSIFILRSAASVSDNLSLQRQEKRNI
ncbi:hypothetical protein GpSGHVEth047 [Glossina pallidipes salivary gland hypertrophy virus]|uniref:Uncharacterized protein n=1 Tax=Glossina hytrovirus (isolate Glossina pallidipes/Ethiopia/Seibersdorf/-) TaxID=379529 RepID=A0A0Y0KBD6_GHVS|nr:hypothetical protein GpSGHVEth047 [Glossina pallidipes salivary gland hypertrophy virus]